MNLLQRRCLILRAVPLSDIIYGVFRLSAAKRLSKINSIYGEFKADKDFHIIQTPKFSELFFYGNRKDFEANCPNPQEAIARADSLFPNHLERTYSKNTKKRLRNGTGYARISIEKMRLDKERSGLLSEVFDHYKIFLEPSHIVRVEVPSKEDAMAYRNTVGNLNRFPPPLADLALEAGYYFKSLRDEERIDYRNKVSTKSIDQTPRRSRWGLSRGPPIDDVN